MTEYEEFLVLAYCALVVRGYNRERDVEDPILRKVWRYGKILNKAQQSGALKKKKHR